VTKKWGLLFKKKSHGINLNVVSLYLGVLNIILVAGYDHILCPFRGILYFRVCTECQGSLQSGSIVRPGCPSPDIRYHQLLAGLGR